MMFQRQAPNVFEAMLPSRSGTNDGSSDIGHVCGLQRKAFSLSHERRLRQMIFHRAIKLRPAFACNFSWSQRPDFYALPTALAASFYWMQGILVCKKIK